MFCDTVDDRDTRWMVLVVALPRTHGHCKEGDLQEKMGETINTWLPQSFL